MALLLLFAAIAGAGTALWPCVLPVLPALLTAGATGGRRRPLGIVLGLAVTFTVTIVGLAELVDGVGLSAARCARRRAGPARLRGAAARAAARRPRRGVAVAARCASARARAATGSSAGSASAPRSGSSTRPARARCSPPSSRSAPPPGPRSPSRSATRSGQRRAARARLGGRRVLRRVRGPALQRVLGAVMVLTALAILSSSTSASRPRSPTTCPPRSSTPPARSSARARSSTGWPSCAGARASSRPPAGCRSSARRRSSPAKPLAQLAAADARRAARAGRADRLLDLHVHQLPPHAAAPARVGRALPRPGLTIVGVHTPEFAFEKDAGNVRERSPAAGSATRSRRTTTTAPGTPGATVLAGQVPDRRARPRPLRALRRGRLRGDRGGDPLAARRARRQPGRRDGRRSRASGEATPRPISARSGPSASPHRWKPGRGATRISANVG